MSWSVEWADGQIQIGGMSLDPTVARDLALRLRDALGAEEDEDPAWKGVSDRLDVEFRGAAVRTGRTLRGEEVVGHARMESPTLCLWRVQRFGVAWLRPVRGRPYWEGPIYRYSPGMGDTLVWRAGRKRVRLDRVLPTGQDRTIPQIDGDLGRLLLAGPTLTPTQRQPFLVKGPVCPVSSPSLPTSSLPLGAGVTRWAKVAGGVEVMVIEATGDADTTEVILDAEAGCGEGDPTMAGPTSSTTQPAWTTSHPVSGSLLSDGPKGPS